MRDAIGLSDSLAKKPIPASDQSAATGLSTATIYRQRRLKADHPELWAEVEAGTKSTHAAAIAAGTAGPGSSFLSNAKRTFEVFPQLFTVNRKNIYDGYMRIAVAREAQAAAASMHSRQTAIRCGSSIAAIARAWPSLEGGGR